MRSQNWRRTLLTALLLLSAPAAMADDTKTVLGPRNVFLDNGAKALMANRGEEGVRLTLKGLEIASGTAEFKMAHSNLCAGFLLIDRPEEALKHCNKVLEKDVKHWRTYNNRALVYMRLKRFEEAETDIRYGQALRPDSRNLKIVKGMYLDETQPVQENIELDERRSAGKQANVEPN
jgi:tetratricopeptide (TPR) repeat protein